MQETYEPQVARMSRIDFLTQGKEVNAFRNHVRSEPCFSSLSSVRGETRFGALGGRGLPLPLNQLLIRVSVRSVVHAYFGDREATIFLKRGSPRKGSQKGSSFNWPLLYCITEENRSRPFHDLALAFGDHHTFSFLALA